MNTSIGIASRLSTCTPMERPIRNDIRMSQRLEYLRSSSSYHFVMTHTTIAVNSEDIA